jgi:hypothetical protein
MRSLMVAPRIGNAASALNRLRQTELESRRQATTILHPDEVSGSLSPARLLSTTLGGKVRPITQEDLAAFRATVARLGSKARQGLTAAEALSLSTPVDIDRARKQIQYSMPARLLAGQVQLVTNAGPQSKATRHHVNLEFSLFAAALARPGTPAQVAQWLTKESPLRFECSCEHFRFFLRFVATAGGWVLGRHEHGYPKLTNPGLDGACCKHLVRVMTDIQSSIGLRQRLAQMVGAERARVDRPGMKAKPITITVRQAEAERMLPKSARRIVVPGSARGTALPGPASRADIQAALKAYAGRTDAGSAAITRALSALLTPPGLPVE